MYKKILITLDGSKLAKQALPQAEAIARQFGATLTLLRVVPSLQKVISVEYAGGPAMRFVDLEQEQQQMIDQAVASLERLADDLKHRQIDTKAYIDVGLPADKIIEHAQDNDIDLIVMSTHGRTGLSRLVYGSVAGKVLAESSCPVLLVRSAT